MATCSRCGKTIFSLYLL